MLGEYHYISITDFRCEEGECEACIGLWCDNCVNNVRHPKDTNNETGYRGPRRVTEEEGRETRREMDPLVWSWLPDPSGDPSYVPSK